MKINAAHSVQEISPPDVIIELGKNLGVDSTVEDIRSNPFLLSQDSRLNLLATGMLAAEFPEAHIVLSGGKTVGPDYPSQPEAARTYLHSRFPELDEGRVTLDEKGFNTVRSAKALGPMMQERGWSRPALITVGYHLPGAVKTFRNLGVHIETPVAAEDIVADRSPLFAAYVARMQNSDRVAKEERRERIRGILLTLDPRSRLLDWLTGRRVED